MNEKANVTKELNAKHRKVLESLLKLPENRECADCKTKGPRWASVNLGIFICMQCSGIHRSLGTHISKVRSATLDTWLPEQVAFIQAMGNEKSNSHWEAELPPNYDRVGIENFIRAKYEDKRWVSRDGKPKSPPERSEVKASMQWPRSTERVGHGYAGSSERLSNERKDTQPTAARSNFPAARVAVLVPPRGPEPVTPVPKPQSIQKVEPVAQQPEPAKPVVQTTPVATPPKVDYATDLFNMLSLDSPSENGSAAASTDDSSWAGFQSAAQEAPPAEKTTPKPVENGKSNSELEDLFKDSPSLTPVAEKPQKDVKNDIMSLFEKTNIVSPYSLHQQQIAMLAQQQSLLMAAAARAAGVDPKNPINTQQVAPNGTALPNQNWPNMAYQIPGMMMMPMPGNQGQARSTGPSQLGAPNVQYPASSFYGMGQAAPVNGVGPAAANKTQTPALVPSVSPTQTGKDYDFSSLTQGFFSKP